MEKENIVSNYFRDEVQNEINKITDKVLSKVISNLKEIKIQNKVDDLEFLSLVMLNFEAFLDFCSVDEDLKE